MHTFMVVNIHRCIWVASRNEKNIPKPWSQLLYITKWQNEDTFRKLAMDDNENK